eukprot:4697737-Pyramimonas_sp.AAC.2
MSLRSTFRRSTPLRALVSSHLARGGYVAQQNGQQRRGSWATLALQGSCHATRCIAQLTRSAFVRAVNTPLQIILFHPTRRPLSAQVESPYGKCVFNDAVCHCVSSEKLVIAEDLIPLIVTPQLP